MSDLYEFKISLFENGELEEFLLFVCNFNMDLAASGTLEAGAKVQWFHLIVHEEELHKFDFFFTGVEITNPLTAEDIIKELSS